MNSPIRALLSCFLGCLLSGCALTSTNVNLPYEPAPVQAPSKGSVAIAPFADARSPDVAVGSQIGQTRDEWAMPIHKIVTNQSPVLWVEDGLARALAANGFRVERVDRPSAAGALPVVTGSVNQVFADMYFRMEASVIATVSVERDGEIVFSTECEGSDAAFAWASLTEQVEARFKAAMEKLVEGCLPKLAGPLLAGALEKREANTPPPPSAPGSQIPKRGINPMSTGS